MLMALGDPLTPANIDAIVTWEYAEGGNWSNDENYNPMNTTLVYAGSTRGDPEEPFQAYTSWGNGLTATVYTLTTGSYVTDEYVPLLKALRQGTSTATILADVRASCWTGCGGDGL